MYFSSVEDLRRRFSSTRAICSSCEQTCGGSRPRRPSASRSSSLNAVPLLSVGSRNNARPACKSADDSAAVRGCELFDILSSCLRRTFSTHDGPAIGYPFDGNQQRRGPGG